MALLDFLIQEIAALTGLTTEEVSQQFTQEQLESVRRLVDTLLQENDNYSLKSDNPN